MAKTAVITGAGAGVGRATALEFARQGYNVALLSRDPERLDALAQKIKGLGRRALPIPTDVADAGQVEAAADRVERELGVIDTWVNVAMATVFAPVEKLTADEVLRATEVTYLGQVHGMMAALKRMRPRRRGVIVNVGSALAYRSVPLQWPIPARRPRSRIYGFMVPRLSTTNRYPAHHGAFAGGQHASIRLGLEQDEEESAACGADLPARGGGPRDLFRRKCMRDASCGSDTPRSKRLLET